MSSTITDRSSCLAPLPPKTKVNTPKQTPTPPLCHPQTNAYFPSGIVKFPKYFNGYYYDNAGNAFMSIMDNPTTKKYCKVPRALVNYVVAPNQIKQIYYQGCNCASVNSCSCSNSCSSCCNDSSMPCCSSDSNSSSTCCNDSSMMCYSSSSSSDSCSS